MIYFVSYVLGLAKRGRENSENVISDDQCSAFIAIDATAIYDGKVHRAKIILYSLACKQIQQGIQQGHSSSIP